jgi:phosphopentomutase
MSCIPGVPYSVNKTRVFIIVLDGVGVGGAPDARDYGDEGSNTLGNLARAEGGLRLPTLRSLGLGNVIPIAGVLPARKPRASWGAMEELSKGKDTITGHWEMMGVVNAVPFPTYPKGFPPEVMEPFERAIGRKALWNRPASGTEIIKKLGDEHMRTGSPIVYTSADSVFQIAAHEDVIPVEELYHICEKAREILVAPHNVCRVIARPFVGPPYKRTPRRHDFALAPPEPTLIDMLATRGVEVVSVGKPGDMFAGRGFSRTLLTVSNADGMAKLGELAGTMQEGMAFCNLVDFDTLYGHRNDTAGFRRALAEFDAWLAGFLPRLGDGDHLFITADHGLDPTTPGTDHSREHVPVLWFNTKTAPKDLGLRKGFYDLGATVARIFGVTEFAKGKGF